MGGMATGVSGDFLQLPPVEMPSLAMPLTAEGFDVELEAAPAEEKDDEYKKRQKERRDFEHRGGFRLWREHFTCVTYLLRNMRTTGPLAEILQGMRRGALSDALWSALQDSRIHMPMLAYTCGV